MWFLNCGNNRLKLKYIPVFTIIAILIFLSSSSVSLASDAPFTSPSNWGATGLMETPTARVIEENKFRLGFSMINPYSYYYVTISPIKGLEFGGRITEISGVPGFSFESAYGNYKDKAFDFKYQLIPESKYAPAIAFGIMDPHGTRLYSSQYVVASKQIYPFDFTLGFGNGRFGITPLPKLDEKLKLEILSDTKGWLTDSQFFWGIQFAPSEKYSLMVEYSPILYHKQTQDPALKKYFHEPVPSNFNFGFRWKPYKWTDIGLSFQRGNQVGLNLSMPFDIGNPIIPTYDKPFNPVFSEEIILTESKLYTALTESGFYNIGMESKDGRLVIDLENNKYFYNMRALGVVLSAIAPLVPENVQDIIVIFKENSVPMFSFRTNRQDLAAFYEGSLTRNEFLYLSELDTSVSNVPDNIKRAKGGGLVLGYKPQFQLYLNDPSGFWKGKLGVSGWASYSVWKSASLVAGVALYPFVNIKTSNEPLSIPVRTDFPDYLRKKLIFERLILKQVNRFPGNIFTMFSAGILEAQYSGVDAEMATYLFDGKLMLGLGGSAVKKRDPDNPLLLKKNEVKDLYTTSFINTRINFPAKDVSLDIKYGRFLAGDVGSRFTISKFIKGVTLSAWYSFTDTSVFNDNINRGYHDKGIAVTIPMRLFEGKDTRAVYGQAMSPWTRDVAQDIEHFTPLFDFIGRNTRIFLEKDRTMMYP